jgi:hypothetical protein
MRKIALLLFPVLLTLGGCTRDSHLEVKRDPEPAARKAGKAAHEIADESKHAAKVAGEKIREAAKEAREGWKEAGQEDKYKKKSK